jgi:hypothetical protein
LVRYGKPEIVDTNLGSQFTGAGVTGMRQEQTISLSTDGRCARSAGCHSSRKTVPINRQVIHFAELKYYSDKLTQPCLPDQILL